MEELIKDFEERICEITTAEKMNDEEIIYFLNEISEFCKAGIRSIEENM